MSQAFAWSEMYSVHIEALDRQHQTLFSTINELNDALSEGRGGTVVDDVLGRLVEYTATHFAAEEGLMRKYGFPGLGEHRQKHEELTRKVQDFVKEHKAGKVGVPAELMLFLQGWLRDHILGTDHEYGPFLNAKGVH